MINFIFGDKWTVVDLAFGWVAELFVAILALVGIAMLGSWLRDFNGAMKIYREIKGENK